MSQQHKASGPPSRRVPLIVGLLAILAVAATVAVLILRDPNRPVAAPERWHWGRLAVLPFQPEPAGAQEPWLGDLLTAAVERGAVEQRRIRVNLLSRAEVTRALETEPAGLAPELRAARLGRRTATPWVVSGRFALHPQGGRIQAAVNFVRARDGKTVQAFTRTGSLEDPEKLGQTVAEGMAVPLTSLFQADEPLELGRAQARDGEVREAFLEAQQLFNADRRVTADNIDRIRVLLDHALARQPDLVPARRLDLHARLARHALSGDAADLARAIAAAEWLREATDAPDAWLQLCQLHRLADDPQQALQACETARKRDPGRTPYLALAELLFEFGRDKDAGEILEEALAQQPHVGWLFLAAARQSLEHGVHEQAEALAREAAALQDAEIEAQGNTRARSEGWPALNGAHALLARLMFHRGNNREAIEQARKEFEQLRTARASRTPELLLEAGLVLRLAGQQIDDAAAAGQGAEIEQQARAALLGQAPTPAAYLRAAKAYGADEAEEALALCRKGLEQEAEHPALNRLAAILAARTDDNEASTDYAERAIRARAERCRPCAEAYRRYIQRAIERW